VPTIRRQSRDKSRKYGEKAHTRQRFTLRTAANAGTQAAVVNEAIADNAQAGVPFAVEDVLRWQKPGGRKNRGTMSQHLDSLVGKGFLEEVVYYQLRSDQQH